MQDQKEDMDLAGLHPWRCHFILGRRERGRPDSDQVGSQGPVGEAGSLGYGPIIWKPSDLLACWLGRSLTEPQKSHRHHYGPLDTIQGFRCYRRDEDM